MPLNLSNAAIQQFKMDFTLKFQELEKLRGTVTEIMGTRGDAYKIPLMGQVVTSERGAYQSLIEASNVDIEQAIITFKNYTANLPLDIFQSHETATNCLNDLSRTHAKSMGRRCDQVVFDALDAGAGETIAVGTTNLTVDKINAAKAVMDDENVTGDRYICLTASQIQGLLKEEEVTNILYNNQRTLVDGEVGTFLGFKILKPIGIMAEGGLPKDGDDRTVFAWSKDAISRAFQMAPSVDVQWSAAHQSWLTISRLRLGAAVTQAPGVVKIICDETK